MLSSLVGLGPESAAGEAPALVNASNIRFSQSSVNGVGKIVESMAKNGWVGEPVTVVRMSDGKLTTIDNTRVLAAALTNTKVQANIVDAAKAISESQASRFVARNGELPSSWGEALSNRIQSQSSAFKNANPNGSPITGISTW